MKTLIIPCAGKSSRFPNMKPKYLLTYPDGKLMLQKAIEGMDLTLFQRIIITIIRDHEEKYEAKTILEQIYKNDIKIEILMLEDFTSCQAETVALTLCYAKVEGEFWVKDSDNYVEAPIDNANAIVGLNIETYQNEVNRLAQKSFLVVNEQGNIIDIIEKKITSQYICIGVYGFENAELFIETYKKLKEQKSVTKEIYISHIVSYLIGTKKCVFKYVEAKQYEDWGTLADWRIIQKSHALYFVNLDGVLIQNRSKYGSENWGDKFICIDENMRCLQKLSSEGAQIVITSTRDESYRKAILDLMSEKGIVVHQLILECYYSPQIIINDFSPSNHYPSCQAINIPRNGKIDEYI